MNKINNVGLISLASLVMMSFTSFIMRKPVSTVLAKTQPVKVEIPSIKIKPIKIEIDQTNLFLNAIGNYESGNQYKITNRFGYMGKYQFGRSTLKGLGYNVTRKEFLNSPVLQERAMLDLLSHNKKILQKYIDYWEGRKIYGKVITESGILAAAHLAGPGNVKRFLRKGENFKDGNGTKLTTYLTHFSGYKLNLE